MRVRRYAIPLAGVVMALASGTARAQERGDSGITMGYPASVGFVYHLTDRLAVRPEVSFTFSDSSSEGTATLLTTDSTQVGTGVSVIFYLAHHDKLRTYVSPRYTYTHARSTSESPFSGTSRTTIASHTVAGTFGAQYALHDRFGVFGEVGVGYTSQSNTSGVIDVRVETDSFASRTGVGVIFYF
jgi:outer membrane protein W